jgi:hypothetical protein
MKQKHAPEYIQIMQILKPLLRKYEPFRKMPFANLCDYVAWFWNRGTISFVFTDSGEAEGVCLIKLFRNLEDFMEPFVHDSCGRFCMIEVMVASHPLAFASMFEELVDRWGKQQLIMWDRGERTKSGAPRMYRWRQFQKLARRITYGITETA